MSLSIEESIAETVRKELAPMFKEVLSLRADVANLKFTNELYISVKEAVERLSVTTKTIRIHVKEEKIDSKLIGRKISIIASGLLIK